MPISRSKWRVVPPTHIIVDAIICGLSLYLSLALRLSFEFDIQHFQTLQNFFLIFIAIRIVTMFFFGLYRSMWRYSSVFDSVQLFKAVTISGLLCISTSYLLPDFGRLPRSIFFIDFFIVMAGLGAVRMSSRLYHERKGKAASRKLAIQNVIIYGAGENGRSLANRLRNDPHAAQNVVGFVDDDRRKRNKVIAGIPVLGTGLDLESIIENRNIDNVIVSISHADGELIRKIVETTRKFNILPQVFNHFNERKVGMENILREVSLNDLLSRVPAEIDFSAIKDTVKGKTVLITGAGGSIGSELARQIYRFQPGKLLIADHSEFNLYNIDKELRLSADSNGIVVPLLIDIKDKSSLSNLFSEHQPEVVYHAAAYKHVHLVELNPFTAILNNVCGTLNLLEMSEKHGVQTFVNVSTDKAVNPVGIMGATKRTCELLTSCYGDRTNKKYCSVRFGNVLGSSGSLIPLLQSQIQQGGPITVTHPDMKRYFMLIPEAVSLVLMASIVSRPGDISVLKMGEQVKILDLARSLIALNGKTENEVKITFTGLRPGEKMYEELYICGDEIKTSHPDILTIPRGDSAGSAIQIVETEALAMIEYAKMEDRRAISILRKLASIENRGTERVMEQ